VADRFPGYNVLAKRDSPSWNAQTRRAIDQRLHDVPPRRFFSQTEWETLQAVCACIIPQGRRDPVPIAPFIDAKMHLRQQDGYRIASQPTMQEEWRRGLAALDSEAELRFGARFAALPGGRQETLLGMVQQGDVRAEAWRDVPPKPFFVSRVLHDIVSVYYAHPAAWNEIGFGGPAAPRGYVRMGFDRRDPWEAEERHDA
jgi:hypothetical protein